MRRRLLLLLALPAALPLAGCRMRTVELDANQQLAWIAPADREIAVRNTGDTILMIVEEDASRDPVGVYNLQPRARRDFALTEGERLTIMSSYNLPGEFRIGYEKGVDAEVELEGPAPAPPLRPRVPWEPYRQPE